MLVKIATNEYQVLFRHSKNPDTAQTNSECLIIDNDGNMLASGLTTVHPKDNFSREKGRFLALKRALSNLTDDREVRSIFWMNYNTWKMPEGSYRLSAKMSPQHILKVV